MNPLVFKSLMGEKLGKLAETKGFEPSRRFPVCTLSRGVPSTTRPPLRLLVYAASESRTRAFSVRQVATGKWCFSRPVSRGGGCPARGLRCAERGPAVPNGGEGPDLPRGRGLVRRHALRKRCIRPACGGGPSPQRIRIARGGPRKAHLNLLRLGR